MTFDEVRSRFENAKPNGSGFTVRCPGHEDRKNSLSLREGDDGKTVMHCHAGCSVNTICDAIGLDLNDLFDKGPAPSRLAATPRREVTAYPYKDENGVLLYENVRFEPKDFRQRHFENGRAVWGLNGTRRVPYRLPELLAATESGLKDIFMVEGEKDADRLAALGFTVTGLKCGSTAWRPEFNQYISGLNVTILRDHDKPGAKFADTAKAAIGSAASVKIVDLFGSDSLADKQGKDVSDWIDARRMEGADDETVAEEISRIADSSACVSEIPIPSILTVRTANEWIVGAKDRPVPRKLFGSLWLENELNIFFGPTGKGKTLLAVQITESIASGCAIPGFDLGVKDFKCLYLDCELSDKQFEGRYGVKTPESEYYSNHYKFSPNFLRAEIDLSSASIDSPTQFQEELQRSIGVAVATNNVKALIVDNISWLRDETEKARAALPLMKGLVELKKRFGLSILVLAHTPKRDLTHAITLNHLQGSAVLANFADAIFAIGESGKDSNLRYLKQLKVRSAEQEYGSENVKTCQIIRKDSFLGFEFGDEVPESHHLKTVTEEEVKDRRERVANLLAQGMSQRDVAKEIGVSVSTVNKYAQQCSPRSDRSQGERTNEQENEEGYYSDDYGSPD